MKLLTQLLVYGIVGLLVFALSGIWINDFKHLSFKRLAPVIIMFVIGFILNIEMEKDLLIWIVAFLVLATLSIIFQPTYMHTIFKIIVPIFHGILIASLYKSLMKTNDNTSKLIFIGMFLYILHLNVFPENWKVCGIGRTRLCYNPVL